MKKIFCGIAIYAVLLWIALALGYNSYKEFMQEFEPLSKMIRHSIKAIFPWSIIMFSGIYFVFSFKNKTEGIFLSIQQYIGSIAVYTLLVNLLFFSKGKDILIPLNLSIIYFVILLTVSWSLSKFLFVKLLDLNSFSKLQDWLPPLIYRFLLAYLPKAQTYIKEKPSAPFIIGFMVLLVICFFLSIFKAEKAAEQVANIAYFSLVVGVGIEMCYMIKYGNNA